MLNRLLLGFLLLFVLAGCGTVTKAENQDNSVIKADKGQADSFTPLETKKRPRNDMMSLTGFTWDFGKVKEGTILRHNFIFKNESEKNIKIKKLTSSCGCVVSYVKKKALAPQESAIIEVSFKTKGYSGQVSQFVYVNTDNPDNPIVKFTVRAYAAKQ